MIYIDNSNIKFKNMIMRHMMSDRLDGHQELHDFAEKLGLKRDYFQNNKGDSPHYDISKSLKEKALELGAKEIFGKEIINLIHLHRKNEACTCNICVKHPLK